MPPDLSQVRVTTRAAWRRWLAAHHKQTASIWLVHPKKSGARFKDLSYDAIVEEALCFGWIDSVPKRGDADWSWLRISPRKARSAWSRANKTRVASLIASGKMKAAGLAKIERAKEDGSWSALDAAESLTIPPDLAKALGANGAARKHFDAFPAGSRKIILTWITSARRDETRARRVAETIALAAKNVRANHYRK